MLLNEGSEVKSLMEGNEGSYGSLMLKHKYVSASIEKGVVLEYEKFAILRLLGRWVNILEDLKKKKQVRLYPSVIESI